MTSSKILPWGSDPVAPAAPPGREYQGGAALFAGKADEGWNRALGGWEGEAFRHRCGVVRVLLDCERHSWSHQQHAGPVRKRRHTCAHGVGDGSGELGPGSEKVRVRPEGGKAGPGNGKVRSEGGKAGLGHGKVGPGSEKVGPGSEKAGPGSEKVGPGSGKVRPEGGKVGPGNGKVEPGNGKVGPGGGKVGFGSGKVEFGDVRVGSVGGKVGPGESRMGQRQTGEAVLDAFWLGLPTHPGFHYFG